MSLIPRLQDPEDFNAPDLTDGERQELMVQWWDYPLPNMDAFEGSADDSTPNMTDYLNVSRLTILCVERQNASNFVAAHQVVLESG